MSIIVWEAENTSDDNESNFDKISYWWEQLKDQVVIHRTSSGSRNGGFFEREASLTIHNPRLANKILSFNGCNMPVKKLELTLQERSLEVHTADSSTIQVFELGMFAYF
ncbi:hypothetical protein [Coleofasciculus sp. FACHB-SPT9]|uniref:hypothetical protein n=1 Tax=Cyanophyceae TaxID=3028117 RepID=UPI00168700E2|nr:hypothetical protein [Coleofasciculus sp. FACHB-SPT9]MBD1892920.1 hypothetical protein [Coleofasciculus sp. FACHB-SPT9]